MVWVVDNLESLAEERGADFKKLLNENVSRIVPVAPNPDDGGNDVNKIVPTIDPSASSMQTIPPSAIQEDTKDLLMSIVAQGQC